MTNSSNTILIVDSDKKFSASLSDSFQKIGWNVFTVADGRQATQHTHKYLPNIILMNTKLPVLDGIITCRMIKNDVSTPCYFPIIMMSDSQSKKQIISSIEAGCDDFILKPFAFDVLLDKVKNLVGFYQKKEKKKEEAETSGASKDEADIIKFSRKAIKRAFSNAMHGKLIDYPTIKDTVDKMVEILHKENNLPLAFKMKSYNDYTYIHSINVGSLCMSFAYHLEWNDSDLQIIGEGAFLHDIGKTKIDLKILLKPDKLTDEEFLEMKKHPRYSQEIMAKQNIQTEIMKVAMEHHERWDGSGYPNKLSNGQISKYGRVSAIVDVYDAITTDRCYHKAIESEKAINNMVGWTGQFDPELIKKFEELICSETIGK